MCSVKCTWCFQWAHVLSGWHPMTHHRADGKPRPVRVREWGPSRPCVCVSCSACVLCRCCPCGGAQAVDRPPPDPHWARHGGGAGGSSRHPARGPKGFCSQMSHGHAPSRGGTAEQDTHTPNFHEHLIKQTHGDDNPTCQNGCLQGGGGGSGTVTDEEEHTQQTSPPPWRGESEC